MKPDAHEQAKAANRRLYDALGANYELADGRRGAELRAWLEKRIAAIRAETAGGTLLDLGTGTGFVLSCAEGIFEMRIGVDVSARVLPAAEQRGAFFAAADCDSLPFRGASFDAVTCFAVLHHLHSHEALLREVARVLKPGGIFYSDHDMDAAFARRFAWPLAAYRKLRKSEQGYERLGIDKKLYAQAEVHSKGIDSAAILSLLRRCGLEPSPKYHWRGLNPLADKIFGERGYWRGVAPLFSCVARKG